jgi:hypothetical protein
VEILRAFVCLNGGPTVAEASLGGTADGNHPVNLLIYKDFTDKSFVLKDLARYPPANL